MNDRDPVPESPLKKPTDNTPSVLRELPPASMGVPLQPRESVIPVLELPRSYVIWKKARPWLAAGAVAAILLAVGLSTRSCLVEQQVEKTVDKALDGESTGLVEEMSEAREALHRAVDNWGEKPILVSLSAWLDVLWALQFGDKKGDISRATESVERAEDLEDAMSMAARAGLLHLLGKHKEALDLSQKGLGSFPDEPRLGLVRALCLLSLGDFDKGMDLLVGSVNSAPAYYPLVISGLQAALEAHDKVTGLALALKLGKSLRGKHLLESLARVAFSLHGWGEEEITREQAQKLLKAAGRLRVRSLPPPPFWRPYWPLQARPP